MVKKIVAVCVAVVLVVAVFAGCQEQQVQEDIESAVEEVVDTVQEDVEAVKEDVADAVDVIKEDVAEKILLGETGLFFIPAEGLMESELSVDIDFGDSEVMVYSGENGTQIVVENGQTDKGLEDAFNDYSLVSGENMENAGCELHEQYAVRIKPEENNKENGIATYKLTYKSVEGEEMDSTVIFAVKDGKFGAVRYDVPVGNEDAAEARRIALKELLSNFAIKVAVADGFEVTLDERFEPVESGILEDNGNKDYAGRYSDNHGCEVMIYTADRNDSTLASVAEKAVENFTNLAEKNGFKVVNATEVALSDEKAEKGSASFDATIENKDGDSYSVKIINVVGDKEHGAFLYITDGEDTDALLHMEDVIGSLNW